MSADGPGLGELARRLREDLARHEGAADPAVWPLLVYRIGRAAAGMPRPLRGIGGKTYGALALGVELLTGTRLHREMDIGDDLHLMHGRNVRVHPDVVLGARVGLMHDVTIGLREGAAGAPVLEDDVFVGAGAKILGPVRLGRACRVAANSLVITDIPPGATAMGVPARPLPARR